MGEIVTRNMYSKAIAENKNAIVASCWTYFTTMTKLIDAFCNFANVPKNYTFRTDHLENLTPNAMCTVWCSVGLSD